MQRHPRFPRSARMTMALVLAALACVHGRVEAAVQWHADLGQAKAAAQVSRRPVLILFVATWSEPSVNHDNTFLRSEESVALLTACFEPVRIDIDADKATPARLDVRHVPCACVVDADERLLARFDCPESSAAFVAAAGRAAQDAAVACAGPLPTQAPPAPPTQPSPGPLPQAGPTPGPVAAAVPAPVDPALPAPSSPAAPAPATAAPAAPPPSQTDAVAPGAAAPTLAGTPPAWPAETATQSVTTAAEQPAVAPPAPAVIDPPPAAQAQTPGTASAPVGTASSWLAPAPAPAPAAPPAAARAAEPAKKPAGFWATVQKPFGSWLGKPTKTAEAASEPTDIPSTGVPGDDLSSPAPVGLEGYCPVTLVEKGAWAEGRAKWGVRHRGRTYLCAGPEEQRSFRANPDRYAPGLSGDDPVLAFDGGKRSPGQRQYGVSYRSKIYLFSSPDTQAAFRADPQKYAQRVQVAEQPSGAPTVR